jgi:hypothetical protein
VIVWFVGKTQLRIANTQYNRSVELNKEGLEPYRYWGKKTEITREAKLFIKKINFDY